MKTNDKSYGDKLRQLFEELLPYWLEKTPRTITTITEEASSSLSLAPNSNTPLCFFATPNELVSMYHSYVFPIFKRYGLTPIAANDITSPNKNIVAITSSFIERAIMVIVDISIPKFSYKFEIDLALTKDRRLVIIREKNSFIDPAIIGLGRVRVFERPHSSDSEEFTTFIQTLEKYVREESQGIIPQLISEPDRLLNLGENRSAVISAFILLETELRERLQGAVPDRDRLTLRNLLDRARRFDYIDETEYELLLSLMPIRNKLIHTDASISQQEANNIVRRIQQILGSIRAQDTLFEPRRLNPQLRDILTLIADLSHNDVKISVYDTAIVDRRPKIPAEEIGNYLSQLVSLGYISEVVPRPSGVSFRLYNISKEGIEALTNQYFR